MKKTLLVMMTLLSVGAFCFAKESDECKKAKNDEDIARKQKNYLCSWYGPDSPQCSAATKHYYDLIDARVKACFQGDDPAN